MNKTIELQIPFNNSTTSSIYSQRAHQYIKGNIVTFEVEVKSESVEKFDVKFRAKK